MTTAINDEEMVAYLAKVAGLGIDVSGQAQDMLAKYGFNPSQLRGAGGKWTTGSGDQVQTRVSGTPQRQAAERQISNIRESADTAAQQAQIQGRMSRMKQPPQANPAAAEATARKNLGIPTGKQFAALPAAQQKAAQQVLGGIRDAVRNKNMVDRESAQIDQLQAELNKPGVTAKTGAALSRQIAQAQARLAAAKQGLSDAQGQVAAGRKAWKKGSRGSGASLEGAMWRAPTGKGIEPDLVKAAGHNWKHGWIWVGPGAEPSVHHEIAAHHRAMAEGRHSDAVANLRGAAEMSRSRMLHEPTAESMNLDHHADQLEQGVKGGGRLTASDRAFHEHAAAAHQAAAAGRWQDAFHHQAAAHAGHPSPSAPEPKAPRAPREPKALPDGREDAKRLINAKTRDEAVAIASELKGQRLAAAEHALGVPRRSGIDAGTRRNDLVHFAIGGALGSHATRYGTGHMTEFNAEEGRRFLADYRRRAIAGLKPPLGHEDKPTGSGLGLSREQKEADTIRQFAAQRNVDAGLNLDEMHRQLGQESRQARLAEQRARRAATDRRLGLKPGATPEQVHAAVQQASRRQGPLFQQLNPSSMRQKILDTPRSQRQDLLESQLNAVSVTEARRWARQLTGSNQYGRSDHAGIIQGILQHFNAA